MSEQTDDFAKDEADGRAILARERITECSPEGARCALLLHRFLRGFHHSTNRKGAAAVDWTRPWVEFVHGAEIASFDGNEMTRLVFLAHDLSIRVAVKGAAPGYLRFIMTPRPREGWTATRHPTLTEALARWS